MVQSLWEGTLEGGGHRDACLHLCLLWTDLLDCVPTYHVERELVENVPDRKSLIQTSGALPWGPWSDRAQESLTSRHKILIEIGVSWKRWELGCSWQPFTGIQSAENLQEAMPSSPTGTVGVRPAAWSC